ncbi:MAG: hypothetical protein AAFQ68_07320 [Bacteroidota bacterium]
MSLKQFSDNNPIEDLPNPDIINIPVSGVIDGLTGMVREGIVCIEEYREGKISQSEVIDRVYSKGVLYGSRTTVALSFREGAKAAATRFGQEWMKRLTRSNAMTSIAYGMVDQSIDTYKWKKGQLSEVQYKVSTVKNIGSTGGAIGGVMIGTMIGSVVPGPGSMLGAMLGGMIGGMYGAEGGKNVGEAVFGPDPEAKDNDKEDPTKYIHIDID